ncbi:MAG: hypothetical protein RL748_1640 [Pseudomonadota bacterium]|jgi:hypothetical protein
MKTPRRSDPAAQAGRTWHPSFGYLLLALLLVLGGLVFLWMMPDTPGDPDAGQSSSAASTLAATNSSASAAQPAPAAPAPSHVSPPLAQAQASAPEGDADPTRDLTSVVMRGEKPTMPEVIDRLHKAGVYTGLGAFNPPGTRPPLVGLAVPEDFVLPDGYVRHHQATDDGQRIEAILMFAPDRQFFDANKKPIVVPANRVVPPEHAPPGLPIRRIVLPKPIDPQAH